MTGPERDVVERLTACGCGKRPSPIFHARHWQTWDVFHTGTRYRVLCDYCGLSTGEWGTKAEAAKNWNRAMNRTALAPSVATLLWCVECGAGPNTDCDCGKHPDTTTTVASGQAVAQEPVASRARSRRAPGRPWIYGDDPGFAAEMSEKGWEVEPLFNQPAPSGASVRAEAVSNEQVKRALNAFFGADVCDNSGDPDDHAELMRDMRLALEVALQTPHASREDA